MRQIEESSSKPKLELEWRFVGQKRKASQAMESTVNVCVRKLTTAKVKIKVVVKQQEKL